VYTELEGARKALKAAIIGEIQNRILAGQSPGEAVDAVLAEEKVARRVLWGDVLNWFEETYVATAGLEGDQTPPDDRVYVNSQVLPPDNPPGRNPPVQEGIAERVDSLLRRGYGGAL
jgi:hypothetical protein